LLAGLNFLVAVFLFLATKQTDFVGLMITVTLAMLCYMPSWSLTSSIAMSHISSEQFPRIRLLGSIGWVASGVFSLVAVKVFNVQEFDGTVLPLYCGSGAAVIAALFNLTLPNTPPTSNKSEKYSIADTLGLKVISSLKNKNFNLFIVITFLATIPFALFYNFGSQFLANKDFTYITVTLNWGQVAELFFLFITTSILIKYGVKKALLFGLTAMLIRYLSLYTGIVLDQAWCYIFGILTHGLIFGLFFVAGQVYTDKAVPQEFKAQAQGFLSLITWGLGIFVGNLISGWMINNYKIDGQTDWAFLFLVAAVATVCVMVLFILFFKNPPSEEANKNQ
jgi:nucleoside transporter